MLHRMTKKFTQHLEYIHTDHLCINSDTNTDSCKDNGFGTQFVTNVIMVPFKSIVTILYSCRCQLSSVNASLGSVPVD